MWTGSKPASSSSFIIGSVLVWRPRPSRPSQASKAHGRHGLAALALAAAAGPAAALGVCLEGAYPPFSETAADGTLAGFDVDIAAALCAEIGETCEQVKVDWDGMIPALNARRHPDRVAVIDDEGELTFGELDAGQALTVSRLRLDLDEAAP